MPGSITSACSCRDPATGKRYRKGECPSSGKRGHERYYFIVDLDRRWDATERRWRRQQLKSAGFATKTEAERALEVELPRIRNHTAPSLADRQITVGEYLNSWLGLGLSASGEPWRPSTVRTYTSAVENYLLPALGRVRVVDLRRADIERMLQRMRTGSLCPPGVERKDGEELSPTAIRCTFAALRAALSEAVRDEIISRSPCTAVRIEGADRAEALAWEPQQVTAFLALVQQEAPHLAPAFQIAAWRGLREGEVCALRWSDLDLDAGTLRVERSVSDYGEIGEPKTKKGRRTVSLGPKLVAVLRAHRLAQPVRGLPPEDWVFPRAEGGPLRPERLRKLFKQLVRKLPELLPDESHFHTLRHSAATSMLLAGVAPKVVQDQLGHATLAMTMDTYGHVIQAQRDSSAEAVEALYGETV